MREGESVWTARAEADLQREYSALENRMEGSGDALLRMVDSSLRLLTIMPEMAPVYAGQYRRLVLRNSRFGLF